MIRRPPRSTRTDALFPYTPLFRSALVVDDGVLLAVGDNDAAHLVEVADVTGMQPAVDDRPLGERRIAPIARHHQLTLAEYLAVVADPHLRILQRRTDRVHLEARRSAERRVGKECVSTCRSRWSPNHYKKTHT